MILGVLIVVAIWLGAIFVTDWIREGRVDTWVGPDTTVQSGLRLDGCPDIVFRENVYFPSWIRFEGKVFRWARQPAADRPEQRAHVVRGDRLRER